MRCVNLDENESHIYPNMCAKFGCGPTVVSKRGGGVQTGRHRQTDKGKLQHYIVDYRVGLLTREDGDSVESVEWQDAIITLFNAHTLENHNISYGLLQKKANTWHT